MPSDIAGEVKRIRAALNMTQAELAEALGFGRSRVMNVSRWETGANRPAPPVMAYLRELAKKANLKRD